MQKWKEGIKQGKYSLFKLEDKNRNWIERARKDYIVKVEHKNAQENFQEFLLASGFEDQPP